MANRVEVFTKDPDSTLDWQISWAIWLADIGDVIVDSDWIVSGALVIESDTFTDTETTVWLSGGTVGTRETVTNRITTAAGRIEDYSFVMTVKEK